MNLKRELDQGARGRVNDDFHDFSSVDAARIKV